MEESNCYHSHSIINLSIINNETHIICFPMRYNEVYILAKMFNRNLITFYKKYRRQKKKLRTPQGNTQTNPGVFFDN